MRAAQSMHAPERPRAKHKRHCRGSVPAPPPNTQ